MPALATAAAATTTLRVGALVFDNDYKHPVVLAKELATMDVLSGRPGRDRHRRRLDGERLRGGRHPLRPARRPHRPVRGGAGRHQGGDGRRAVLLQGEHYTITDYDGLPMPVQRPHPPILIGGGGRRVLSIAAREADIVGINGNMRGRRDRSGRRSPR